MKKWVKNNMPGAWNFFSDFFEAMNNKSTGHSLRKWLAVGFYWLMLELSLRYTDETNLVPVLGIHAGMITALVITYSASNNRQKRIEKETAGNNNTDESAG